MRYDPSIHHVCVITDERLSFGKSHLDIARLAIAGGANFIQFRDKTMSSRELFECAVSLVKLCAGKDVLLTVNDRVDIAVAAGADGVHLGADDMPLCAARKILGPGAVIGASARTVEEAARAAGEGADYLGVGPVFEARLSKPDTLEPQGVELIRMIAGDSVLPVIAIGGINERNTGDVIMAGAEGVAVISAVVAAENVTDATARLIEAVQAARGAGDER